MSNLSGRPKHLTYTAEEKEAARNEAHEVRRYKMAWEIMITDIGVDGLRKVNSVKDYINLIYKVTDEFLIHK